MVDPTGKDSGDGSGDKGLCHGTGSTSPTFFDVGPRGSIVPVVTDL